MGVEAVHRALARQSLGLLGNDRAFMKFNQPETAQGAPNQGQKGFTHIETAVTQLLAAGFNFGGRGREAGPLLRLQPGSEAHPDRRRDQHLQP